MLAVPYIFGEFILFLSRKSTHLNDFSLTSRLTIKWFIGILSLAIIAIDLQYFRVFWIYYFLLTFVIVFTAVLFLIGKVKGENIAWSSEKAVCLLFSALIGISPVVIASMFIPFPWFGMNHGQPSFLVQPVLRAIEDSYLMPDIRVVEVILALFPCVIFGVDPSAFAWSARFLLGILFSFGVFLLVFEIFKDRYLALLTTFISSFILSAGANPLNHLFFDIPAQSFRSNTIIFSLFPWLILLVEKDVKKEYKDKRTLFKHLILLLILSTGIFIYLMFPMSYYFDYPRFYKLVYRNPPIMSVILFLGVVSTRFLKENRAEFALIFILILVFFLIHVEETILVILVFFLYFLITKFSDLTNIGFFLRLAILIAIFYVILVRLHFVPSYFDISFLIPLKSPYSATFKFNDLIQGNSLLVLFLFAIGSGIIFLQKKQAYLKILALSWMLLFIYLLPIPWTYRIFKELNLFMAFVIAFPLYFLVKRLLRYFAGKSRFQTANSSVIALAEVRAITIMIIATLLLPILAQPIYDRFSFYCEFFPQVGIQSQMTYEEWEAALWIREEIPKDYILVSDYFTCWVLTPLSNKVWAIEKSMEPPENIPNLLLELAYIKHRIFQAKSSKDAYEAIKKIKPIFVEELYVRYLGSGRENDYKYVIIISKRTAKWVELHDSYYGFVWYFPRTEEEMSRILKIFQDESYFKLVYKNDFLYVFVTKG